MKCLPSSKVPLAAGVVLHDWHAEIIALRALNRFLIDECAQVARRKEFQSAFIRRRHGHELSEALFQPFAIMDDVGIHMYCSEAPCGDASMELTMDAQEDATPWPVPDPVPDNISDAATLHGRGNFSQLGTVRRKPCMH